MRGKVRTGGLLLLSLSPLAGCADDGVSPVRTPAGEVAGIYRVCALEFTPASRFLPAVDLRTAAFETSAAGVAAPRLQVDSTGVFELEYTPRGRFTDVEHRGTFVTGDGEAVLTFTRPADVAPLLLPGSVAAEWDAAASTLTPADPFPYTVAKADYERLLGESDPGIPAQVEGRLAGRFARGDCP
ncbi:MAG TPA: hypothetical protein VHG51_15120 [Longimicrobiaceae bacterium]|nr:hypothetical protein [Longimicrobiaceae bacterium]